MQFKNADEARAALRELVTEIERLGGLDEPTDKDATDLGTVIEWAEEARTEAEQHEERAEKIERVKEFAARKVNTEPGADAPTVVTRKNRNIYDIREARAAADSPEAFAAEVRSRALQAIEDAPAHLDDKGREFATSVVERGLLSEDGEEDLGTYLARHILHTGSPDYRAKFVRAMKGDLVAQSELHSENRAALSLTNANGGYLVPFELDPTVILTSTAVTNPFRAISRVVQTRTNVWHGVSSAGVTAEWLAEATEAADASPTLSQPTVTCAKAAAYVQASFELIEDSSIASELARLIADAKDRLEGTAFAVGSGSGQPKGIVTALGLVTASRVAGSSGAAGAADLVRADIFALDNDMNPRYRPSASFVGNKVTWNRVRQLGSSDPGTFWVDFGAALPSKCIGYPVYESSAMDSTIVSGSNDDVIILGDFSQYLIADRVGLSVAYNPLVIGSNRRPTGEVGWFAHWRVGADVTDANAFRMLRV